MTHSPNDPMQVIRAQVRDRIAGMGYSVHSVSVAAHVPYQTLAKWLRGTRASIPLESLRRVALVLGWSLVTPAPRLEAVPGWKVTASTAPQRQTPSRPEPSAP